MKSSTGGASEKPIDKTAVSEKPQTVKHLETDEKPIEKIHKSGSKHHIRENATFSWQNIGYWSGEIFEDKREALKQVKIIETYVLEHFYADWYWNTSLMIGTCFFAWLAARIGGGILSLIIVLLFTSSVYRTELRRFNRNIRDDMTRVYASNRLENELETMEWLNSFLDKFWVIYMPAFSATVMYQTNEIMKGQAPGFGIEAISLDEFTLGSKAPRINSIKSYTKKGQDHIEMDWNFSFAPNDTDDMTKNEIKKKINPKVALGVTIGKAFISKSLPILVEDMSFTGRMNIKFKLTQNFPHVKMVSVQFLEAPTIDYSLKPVGGDTLGLDIMSFIPGLSKFVNGLIHATMRPYLYAPNSLDIDVEALMAARSNDSNGVVAVTIKKLTNLKIGNPTPPNSINPYVQLKISNNADLEDSTSVKKLINDPIFAETKYLLVNALDGNHLNFNVFHLLTDTANDKLIGSVTFPLAELLQQRFHIGLVKNITEGGRSVGKIEFDVRWYPELPPMKLDDGTIEPITTEVGIVKVNLHEASHLDISKLPTGLLNPYAEIFVNYDLVKTTRELRRTNEPGWDESFESLITQQSSTRIQVLIKDGAEDNIVGRLDSNLQDLTFETARGQQWITGVPAKEGGTAPKFRITTGWKALGMQDDTNNFNDLSIGGVRVQIHSAKGLKNLESVGKVDPYVRIIENGRIAAKTPTIANTLDPHFNNVFYLPVTTDHQHYLLEIMDEEEETLDRTLGSCSLSAFDFLTRDSEGNYVPQRSGEIVEQPVILNGKRSGSLTYSATFIPSVPVYSNTQTALRSDYNKSIEKARNLELKRSEEEQKLATEKPNEYEWIVTEEDALPAPKKKEIPLDELIKYKAGIVSVTVFSGKFDKPDVYVHTLFDDNAYPSGVSTRSEGKELLLSSVGNGFVRDLKHSKLIIRIANKAEVAREKEIISERIYDTLDILKKAKSRALNLNIGGGNNVKVQLDFTPIATPLAPLDTVLDVGIMKLGLIKATDLKSVDSNGKSDPLIVVKLAGVEIFKSDKKKKTLDPVWNEQAQLPLFSRSRDIVTVEVYDWDLTHDDELLGTARLDFSEIAANSETHFEVKLDTQGTVFLSANFKPSFLRPTLVHAGKFGLSSVAGVPLALVGAGVGAAGAVVGGGAHVVGAGAGAAGHVIGSGGGLAVDTVTRGGSFLKHLGRLKKSKKKNDSDSESIAISENDLQGGEKLGTTDEAETESEQQSDHKLEQISEHSKTFDPRKLGQNNQAPIGLPNLTVNDLPPPQRPNAAGNVSTGSVGNANGAPSIRGGAPSINNGASSFIGNNGAPSIVGQNGAFLGHSRNNSNLDAASSFAPLIHGTDAIAGRVSIISATGYTKVSNVEVKVLLKTTTKEKDLYKTRTTKEDKEGLFKWNESVPFKSATTGNLHFIVKEHHTFGKSIDLGHTVYPLVEAINHFDNIILNAGEGQLTINIKYAVN